MNLNLNNTLFVYIVILSLSLSSTLINALRIEEKGKKMFFAYFLYYIKLIISKLSEIYYLVSINFCEIYIDL